MHRTHRARHRLAVGLAATVLVLASSACIRQEGNATTAGGGGGPAGPVTRDNLPDCPVDALDEAAGPVEIELWYAFAGETELYLEALTEEYNASQDKVRVSLKSQGTSYDQVLDKYVAGIPSGQIPDISVFEDISLRQMVDSGTILPAEACEQADDFTTGQLPVVRNYYTADDIYWPGYPNVSEPVLYYNAAMWVAAGLDPNEPPGTLDELRTTAETLQESGVATPLALKLDEWFIECWINGAGGTLVNKDNGREGLADEATFDTERMHELYTWIKDMVDDGLLVGFSDTDGQINHYLALAQKNAAMGPETSTAATTIKAVLGGTTYEEGASVVPGSIDPDGLEVRAAPFPGMETPGQVRVSGSAFYMSNAGSDAEQAASWDFMKYMWSVDAQVGWHLQGSYLPTTQAAAGNPQVTDYWETDLAGQLLKVGYDELVAVDPQRPGPQIGPYPDYKTAIQQSLDSLVFNGASVDDVIAQAQADIQEALTAYNEDNAGG
jgi:sn-glycerol 3-phosphate transport system substrate-binding protein